MKGSRRVTLMKQHFSYRLDRRWAPLFLSLGVRDEDGVDVTDDGRLVATYGRFTVETTLDNIAHTAITGPHRWYTAVGVRLAFTDDGLTFGTNHERGLSIGFAERIRRVIGFRNHSQLWVSVADPEALSAAIRK